uniref:ATPase required for both assembly of type IV secretion complex and secretion of T-DNA complex, VirB4 n=1 Tax=Vibrio sp. FF_291 TaxID=1652832 RepID=A0A0H3ZUT8_9VIBR|nr:ATPase required for both assembly of type IV secretion complex and secretion of T-DNA complex, VirB4 [Vibrio sp. FF_291]
MSYRKKIYQRINKHKHISEMMPLLFRMDDTTAVCKDGSLVCVLKVTGKDYTGMSSEQYDAAFFARKKGFEKDKDFINVDTVSIKRKVKADIQFPTTENTVLNLINDAWKKNFSEVFRTTHYIVLTTRKLTGLQKIGKLIDDSYRVDLYEELQLTARDLQNELSDYDPKLLVKGELNSFFATLINGRSTDTDTVIMNDPTFNHSLANHSITFPPGKDYCIYGKGSDAVYSGWLSIANYPDKPTQQTLEVIFSLPCEFIVYQSFQGISPAKRNTIFVNRKNQISNWGKNGELLLYDLKELQAKIENGELTMVDHYFALEVFAPTLEQLNENISLIRSKLEHNGALYYREALNIEALFWSRFPTEQSLNVRHRPMTSENAAHYATFNSVGEGYDTCRFGARPVTLFKTESNSQFSFTFHNSPALSGEPLGHTAIFGDTDSGKTTLFLFLISQCLPFENFKAIIFDRLHGAEVFTHLMDGDYLDFAKNVQLNPFQMPDSLSNRTFLYDWLCRLLEISDDDTESKNVIDTVVKTNYQIENILDRRFAALVDVFGSDGSELRNRLKKWLPNGSKGQYFNGQRDSLSFKNSMVTFDASLVLKMDDLLPSLTDYLFYRIYDMVSTSPVPNVIMLDEAQRYMTKPIFVERACEFANEIRKLLGVFCPVFQNPNRMKNLPEGSGVTIRDAMANYLIYPNRTADRESYCDFLGLNDREFNWVRDNDPKSRKVLFKRRKSGESVVLNVDLSALNTSHFNLLSSFSSGISDVERINKLKTNHPTDWKLKYLSGSLK